MTAFRTVGVVCPHARPEDGCRIPPGVRYCVCHGAEHDAPVGQLAVREGQLFWFVRDAEGRENGVYSYVAVLLRAGGLEAVELEGAVDFRVVQGPDGRRPCYRVRGKSARTYEIDAASLIDAACEGKEFVACRVHEGEG
jgi:hypothetical protein